VLCALGLKDSPPAAKGGWRCYITNVIKEANLARTQAATKHRRRIEQARQWADILRWEVDAVRPTHVFAVGGRAHEVVLDLQAQSRLPKFAVHRICHFSDRGRGRTTDAVVADMEAAIRIVTGRC
jgi:uracil-DNA glycosylase